MSIFTYSIEDISNFLTRFHRNTRPTRKIEGAKRGFPYHATSGVYFYHFFGGIVKESLLFFRVRFVIL